MQLLDIVPRAVRKRLVAGKIHLDRERLEGVRVKVATTEAEVFGAARLVHQAYVARGIAPPHSSGLMFHPQMVLPSSVIFVALAGEEVVGTMTLVVDSPLGMPLDGTFAPEVDALRGRGERLAELSALAVTPAFRHSGAVHLLNRIAARTALRTDLDRVVITVHPRAATLYETAMLFERFAAERAYASLTNAPAVAMSLRLAGLKARYEREFSFLGPVPGNTFYLHHQMVCEEMEDPSPEAIASSEVRAESLEALARARMDVFRGLDEAQRAFLRNEMKGVLWPSRSRWRVAPPIGDFAAAYAGALG